MVSTGELPKDTKTLLLGVGPSPVPDVQTTQELASQVSNIEGLPVDISEPEDKVSFIMCSSGTTGLPKGVELTNKNAIASVVCLR
jgi:long-subunit acyl-CoA synthetase (AMP-forming)